MLFFFLMSHCVRSLSLCLFPSLSSSLPFYNTELTWEGIIQSVITRISQLLFHLCEDIWLVLTNGMQWTGFKVCIFSPCALSLPLSSCRKSWWPFKPGVVHSRHIILEWAHIPELPFWSELPTKRRIHNGLY